MSFAARNSFRTVSRSVRSRNFATNVESGKALEAYLEADKALAHHAAETTDLWRKISYYVALPAIAVCTAWVYNTEVEHAAHVEHIKHENGGELPETPQYDYMNRRAKPFPWGPNSLFFNPHANKDMS
ncbi:mitochondrial cytochrome c oxidase subunit VIa [Pholiota conissans]|uniref:Cytochrome c oxidase subunit 13, mitochondrial n=1 Tax=Pholiota conissans TaxID=109636 RepID=A0A9P6CWC1_9AGAR|nr:mitochondrial cytochrome c oxidase subunit VIa [Pholiota conissans]